ncbi:DUF2798 domain-containing protein [Pseudoalteromonas luteoviolacea]|uniref:DUF2798 domain-containing protein n=1 Tax=Pseudoalteromonas luteoviolacea TaxID=43657 RepID=UPI001152F09A|nr:DUF2798 domain-containing protein [Pseudoalteromonas luteoviolacea]TQF70031.1 DUF2798 domain-containing protein [Pseudoalteromonas luteoviolacea]
MKRLNSKHKSLLVALFASVGMSFVMSFTMLLINIGIVDNFIFLWLKAWLVSVTVAFPSAILIVPVAQKMANELINT